MSKETDQVYHSYLVRCWLVPRETTDEPALWRFELRQVPAEDQKQRFSDLEGLKAFISAKLAIMAIDIERDDDSEDGR
jgi:hypothetical protein